MLAVQSGGQRGRIVLQEGRAVDCLIEERERLDPRKAFYRVLSW